MLVLVCVWVFLFWTIVLYLKIFFLIMMKMNFGYCLVFFSLCVYLCACSYDPCEEMCSCDLETMHIFCVKLYATSSTSFSVFLYNNIKTITFSGETEIVDITFLSHFKSLDSIDIHYTVEISCLLLGELEETYTHLTLSIDSNCSMY
jgi:hypothetical protein